MTRRTSNTLRFALAAAVGTMCLFASTAGSYAEVYANRSYVTGRPTLVPRYYGGGYGTYGAYAAGGYYGGYNPGGPYGAYAADGYPEGYYAGYPYQFPRYHGGPKGWWY